MWQPIETAPKDGTRIIVIGDYDDWCEVRWDAKHKCWEPSWQGSYGVIEWQGDLSTSYKEVSSEAIRHWLPIPTPPKAAA